MSAGPVLAPRVVLGRSLLHAVFTGAAIGAVIAVTLILLAGCADQPAGSALGVRTSDLWGNRYPAACMRDLSDVDVPVMYVTPETLADINRKAGKPGRRMLGFFNHSPRVIFVDKTLGEAARAEAVRHERCHVVAGEWHS